MMLQRNPVPPPATLLTLAMACAAGAALTWGMAALVQRWRGGPVSPTDEIVERRVRAHAADVLTRPEAVSIEVDQGVVRVSGQLPAAERERFLVSLVDVPGVWRVRNALSITPAGTAG